MVRASSRDGPVPAGNLRSEQHCSDHDHRVGRCMDCLPEIAKEKGANDGSELSPFASAVRFRGTIAIRLVTHITAP